MSPDEERQRGLTRERLVEAALGLIHEEGLEGLSMRALADRLDVKAASLYWHVRDRRELLELLAETILDRVGRPRRSGGWRASVTGLGGALGRQVGAQRDAARVLLEVPESLERSDLFRVMTSELVAAGLQAPEARDVALMLMTHVIAGHRSSEAPAMTASGAEASVAIDSGSRGVVVRAGPPDMQTLFRVPPDQAAAAPAVQRGEAVVVRRLRGVGRGELELNPGRPWRFKVQGPTWNTLLDVGGLDVRAVHVDSGAGKLECFLPRPHGVVPIQVSGGVANISLHRPRGTAVVAQLSSGAVRARLDDFSVPVTVADLHWASDGASSASDRYELKVSSGAVKVTMDEYEPKAAPAVALQEPIATGKPATALDILLDGVEARIAAKR